MMHTVRTKVGTALCLALSGAGVSVWAQVPVDAGRSLEQFRQVPQPLPLGPQVQLPSSASIVVPSGGASVQVSAVTFSGNSRLSAVELLAAVGGEQAFATPLDLARLRELAQRVSDHYRARGFPFARAFLPAQDLRGGALRIDVVEGRYGKVQAESTAQGVAQNAQAFLAQLPSGEVIESAALERATLLLNDLPGISSTPVMTPGATTGEGDLAVVVQEDVRARGGIGLDNHGSRYAGAWRARADLALNHVAMFGDQLSFNALTPMPVLWTGSVNYALPLGAQGWRLQIAHSRSRYQLTGGFQGFEGAALMNSATVSYPLIRSQRLNLGLSMAYQDKDLEDKRLDTVERKSSRVLPLTISFDHRDTWGDGGISYGSLSMASGEVRYATGTKAFKRWTLDVARQQRLNSSWSLFAHVLKQGADSNLDSSEGISLGGATGVRAYPSGESAGDEGWMLQTELRLSLGAWAPFAFYDHGRVRIDARPQLVASPAPDQERAGAGMGLRYQEGAWSFDTTMAWRTQGGAPKADTASDPKPRFWMQTRYAF